MSNKLKVLQKTEKFEHLKEGMIKVLEDELERVKEGKTSALLIIRDEDSEVTGQVFYGKASMALVGECEHVKYMLLQTIDRR